MDPKVKDPWIDSKTEPFPQIFEFDESLKAYISRQVNEAKSEPDVEAFWKYWDDFCSRVSPYFYDFRSLFVWYGLTHICSRV